MNTRKIYDEDGKGFHRLFDGGDFEYVDPHKYFEEYEVQKQMVVLRDMLEMENAFLASKLSEEFFRKRAKSIWDEMKVEKLKVPVPGNFIKLLDSQSKKEQEQLLKGQSLTPDQLIALFFTAYTNFGYTLSSYTSEHQANGIDIKEFPRLFKVEGNSVWKVGRTMMTDGQLKNAILHRKVIVSKFLDRGSEWHCLFQTYKSLRGEETWKGGQPHFHYISDKWNIPRQDVLNAIKSGKYVSTSVHIDLLGYGGQPS